MQTNKQIDKLAHLPRLPLWPETRATRSVKSPVKELTSRSNLYLLPCYVFYCTVCWRNEVTRLPKGKLMELDRLLAAAEAAA